MAKYPKRAFKNMSIGTLYTAMYNTEHWKLLNINRFSVSPIILQNVNRPDNLRHLTPAQFYLGDYKPITNRNNANT